MKIKIYKSGKITIRKYNTPIFLKVSENNSGKRSSSDNNTEEKNISERSLSRTRRLLIDTIENNEECFTTFITLTFKNNEMNINKAYGELRKFLRRLKQQQKKENKPLYYVAVPELQKRGAIHFHIICNVEVGSVSIPKREKKKIKSEGKFRSIQYYDLPHWFITNNGEKESIGFSTAFPINKQFETFQIGLYMAKYLTKDLNDFFFGHQKILKSQNLEKPTEFKAKTTDKLVSDMERRLKDYLVSEYISPIIIGNTLFEQFEEKTYFQP